MSELRIGLAGLGIHGARYAQHLLAGDVPRATLSAVCRANVSEGRAFAGEHGLSFYPTVEELAASDQVDALVVVLPPGMHPDAVDAAARNGKPILVEKPLAIDAESGQRAARAAASAGIPAMVAQTLRYDATVQTLRKHLESLGPLHLAAINQRFEPTGRSWLDDPRHGGLILNTGVHGVDLLRYLTGAEIVSAQAQARRVVTENIEDLFVACFSLEPGGILATLDNSRACDARSGRIEIVGRNGQLVGDHIRRTAFRLHGRDADPIEVGPPVHTVCACTEDFVRAVLDEAPMPIPIEDGLASVEAVDLVRRSLGSERNT